MRGAIFYMAAIWLQITPLILLVEAPVLHMNAGILIYKAIA